MDGKINFVVKDLKLLVCSFFVLIFCLLVFERVSVYFCFVIIWVELGYCL